ncbi:predicted protein [Nematostella vectensis]|uniref:Uncharacterized protein n=1 Tax=Nematostella vectensis TaxID=45351 RepID=A7S3H0_NEMVE|nr:predicted protein [Nematostella vectensis]|eukprot:XP_001633787.1 predicted protein [Nematostella vectensis]
MHRLQVFILLLAVLVTSLAAHYENTILVSPHGIDNETCWESSKNTSRPCRTVNYALEHSRNATRILISTGEYVLRNSLTVQNTYILAIEAEDAVTIRCLGDVGVSFIRSGNISLIGLTLKNCGALHPSTIGKAFAKKAHSPFFVALYFTYCRNIEMVDCTISESPGIGLILYDNGGFIRVKGTRFTHNAPIKRNCSGNDYYVKAGGGVYFEYTFDGSLSPYNTKEQLRYQHDNQILFENCTFEMNEAPELCFNSMIEYPSGSHHMPFGRGGGMSIFMRGLSRNNHLLVKDCLFVSNHAIWGAGLFVEFHDASQNNTVRIQGTVFKNNSATTAGGAVRSALVNTGKLTIANKIVHEECFYDGNTALMSGGVSHFGNFYKPIQSDDYRRVSFENCTWINNKGTLGSSIGLSTPATEITLGNLNPAIEGPLVPYVVTLHNCYVLNNVVVPGEDNQVIGQGSVYSYAVPMVFSGNITFVNNTNTALVLDAAVLKIYGKTVFRDNQGIEGGAIALYGPSVINLMPDSKLYFRRNIAWERGGALFVRSGNPPVVAFNTTDLVTHGCFLVYNETTSLTHVSDWQTELLFEDNTSPPGGGKSVYATTLRGCRRVGEGRINYASLQWKFVQYFRNGEKAEEIKDEISTDPIMMEIMRSDWAVAPSEKFNASVKLFDEKNSLVSAVVNISILQDDVSLDIPSPVLLVKQDSKCHGLAIKGKINSDFDINLRTVGSQFIGVTERGLRLQECLPGFIQDSGTDTCKCVPRKIYDGLSRCEGNNVYLKTGHWGGRVGGQFVTYPCPQGYCSDDVTGGGREYRLDLKDRCAENRNQSSTLCGSCRYGYSVFMGNEKCGDCSNNHLWLLVIFFIGTLMLVLLILKINVDIFTVYLNSWLYSYQIIGFLLQKGEGLDSFLTFVVGIANWELPGYGSCFCSGLTNLYKLGINYGLPIYVLVLLLVLSKIAKLRPGCYINKNVSRAFCTLLVLCYTKITMISFSILHYVNVGNRWVLFYDGEIDFHRDWKEHLPFTVVAILMLLFFVLSLPIMLLFTPWLMMKFPCLMRFRLFFDLFQSCFEDQEKRRNHRWFAAFYLLCRIFIICIALYPPFGPLKRSLLEACCVLICGTCLYIQPYNTRYTWLNTVDALLLVNLALITIFSSGRTVEAGDWTNIALWYIVDVMAYFPLLYLTVLIAVKLVALVRDEAHWENLRNRFQDSDGTSTQAQTTVTEFQVTARHVTEDT